LVGGRDGVGQRATERSDGGVVGVAPADGGEDAAVCLGLGQGAGGDGGAAAAPDKVGQEGVERAVAASLLEQQVLHDTTS
jgi:hypothetical protein